MLRIRGKATPNISSHTGYKVKNNNTLASSTQEVHQTKEATQVLLSAMPMTFNLAVKTAIQFSNNECANVEMTLYRDSASRT